MRMGIDLGGTKIEIRALNKNNGKELYRQRVPTPQSYDEIIHALCDLVRTCESKLGEDGTVGMCIPGTLSIATGRMKNVPNNPALLDKPLDKDFEKALGRPVRLMNDANCFTFSEAVDGAGRGKSVVFGAILGTGCGGGLVVNGSLIEGVNKITGEWGHNPLPWPQDDELPGPKCGCGKHGCLETWISGPGLRHDYARCYGDDLTNHDIINRAHNNDEKANHILNRYCNRVARAFATVINVIDPDVIVIGGGMSKVPDLYEKIPPLLNGYVYSNNIRTEIKSPLHGDSSGVRGAAWLWNDA